MLSIRKICSKFQTITKCGVTSELSLNSRFSGFRSRCAMLSEWQCSKAWAICGDMNYKDHKTSQNMNKVQRQREAIKRLSLLLHTAASRLNSLNENIFHHLLCAKKTQLIHETLTNGLLTFYWRCKQEVSYNSTLFILCCIKALNQLAVHPYTSFNLLTKTGLKRFSWVMREMCGKLQHDTCLVTWLAIFSVKCLCWLILWNSSPPSIISITINNLALLKKRAVKRAK